jgi:[ribosomal protein S5]-alanine N-acetyltransferase
MVKLATERLTLRPFRPEDVAEFAHLAGDWAVASMTSDIPYPFSPTQAVAWIRPVRGEARFAIEVDGRLVGGAGFYRLRSGAAELGFWLGRPWWGRGYATEATQAVVRYGFEERRLPAFSSSHFVDNEASARVLFKLGFEPVGHVAIGCASRGHDVEAVAYRLDRKRAVLVMPPPAITATPRPRWRQWLGRLAGGAA